MKGVWDRPPSMMHPHIFNYGDNFRIPRTVLIPKMVALGVATPLHPYFKAIIEWFGLAPIQLSPNRYKLAIALCILYHDTGFARLP